jgi:nucleotide-binding universal stress UspA family protein
MGSVSDSVVRRAHCPVLVVRAQEDGEAGFPPKKILLATDGSGEAQLAAWTAADLAGTLGSELHVVSVGRGRRGDETRSEAEIQALRWEAEDVLDREVASIREAGREVAQVHLRMAEKRDEAIVGLAEELDVGLIVMGSRGLGGVRRVLMGSVSDSEVRHAHCPVLVVRPEKGVGSPRFLRRLLAAGSF